MTRLRRPLPPPAPATLAVAAIVLVLAPAPAPADPAGGIDRAGMDMAVGPGDDFFAYANGDWVKATEIPPDRASWGANAMLAERVDKQVAALIEGARQSPGRPGSHTRKVGDYYASYMDEAGIEARGVEPLKPGLAAIAAIADRTALAAALGATLRADVDALNSTNFRTDNLFGLWVAADLDRPDRYLPFLLQGGLSLPDREYYVSDTPRMADIRGAFKTHIARMLGLAGIADPAARAEGVFALESAIAQAHWTRAQSEDVEKADNHWSRDDFSARAPGLDWTAFFAAAGLKDQRDFAVWQPSALIGEAALVGGRPLDAWKDYLAFHYIDRNANLLPKSFVDERFAFYGAVLSGTPALQPRWKRAVAATNAALGEAVGRLYVARYFPPRDKAAVQGMVSNLIAAFGRRIRQLDWMSPQTRARALAKLATLKVGIGYPDRWRSYEGLEVVKGDAFGNAQRAQIFDYRQKLARLNGPVDRGEWVMNPQLVNAVNLPVLNALNFPAAELQPPHFDPAAPASINYGSIGAIIGHEISHSFDDQGALFDASGRLSNWWTPADFAHFQASSAALAQQFDGYKPFPDLGVNGRQTLSENIADVAGLSAAWDAYRLSLGDAPAPAVDGFSGDQSFFIAFGQTWRNKTREAALRQQLLTDGHAPAQYRAQTVRNLDAWYSAFAVRPGQALYLAPADRVKMW